MEIAALIISIAIIIILSGRGYPLYYGMFLSSIIIVLSSRIETEDLFSVLFGVLLSPSGINVIFTVFFISFLTKLMEENQILERLVESLTHMIKNPRITLMIVPFLVGSLPVAGGAIISAPLVDNIGKNLQLSNEHKCAINLFFRHGGNFILPYRASFILVTSLGFVKVLDLIKLQLPLNIIMIIAGYYFLIKNNVPKDNKEMSFNRPGALGKFLFYSLPIMTPLFLIIVFNCSTALSMFVGMVLTGVFAAYKGTLSIPALLKKANHTLVVTMASILIFGSLISNLGSLNHLVQTIFTWGLPINVMVFIIPSFFGFVSGNIASSIAISLPLLMGFIGGEDHRLYVMVIYSTSVLFYLISPLHPCQALTLDYFNVSLFDIYKEYLPAVMVLLFSLVLLFFLYRAIL